MKYYQCSYIKFCTVEDSVKAETHYRSLIHPQSKHEVYVQVTNVMTANVMTAENMNLANVHELKVSTIALAI